MEFEEHENTQPEETVEAVETNPSAEKPTEATGEQIRPSVAVQSFEYNLPTHNVNNYHLSLPSLNLSDFGNKLKQFNRVISDTSDPSLNEWKKVSEEAVDYYTPAAMYQDRLHDEKSKFVQGTPTNTEEILGISPLKFKKTDGELKGEIAVLKMSKLLGIGDVVTIPLPHSGIWVTLKPPTETALIDFYNSVFREKVMLGRATYGLTLTNFSVHINNKLCDFIINHIHSLNYGDIPKEDLKNYMLVNDFPILAWGFAAAQYPNGFEYQRACTNDLTTCSYIAKDTINLTKLLWTDTMALSEYQRVILTENRPNKHTTEVYRKYISEHVKTTNRTFSVGDNLKFSLKVPTFAEYVADGLNWVNAINSSVDSVILSDDISTEEKTELLNQKVKSSILRQFNGYIDWIEIEENAVTDRATINNLLQALSSEDESRTKITEEILKFKNDTVISLIGIPEYVCPKCGHSEKDTSVNERFVNVIPLDVMNLFFTLITLRISRIMERKV